MFTTLFVGLLLLRSFVFPEYQSTQQYIYIYIFMRVRVYVCIYGLYEYIQYGIIVFYESAGCAN